MASSKHYRYGAPVQGAQMILGDTWIMLESVREGRAPPVQLGQRLMFLAVIVDDVTAHFDGSESAGATIVELLDETVYGERQYVAEDP